MYIIYKVTISSINTGNNEIDDVKIDIDTIVNKIGEARHYIANMEYIIHNNAKCIITKVGETKPNDKDDDGYYLLINKDNEDRVDIYRKKTKLLEGYLYNSYEIKIEKIAFFEIQYFDKTVNENEIHTATTIITKNENSYISRKYELPKNVLDELKIKLDEIKNKNENHQEILHDKTKQD
tara:strand:- start:1739 stop:2278 length:540 start_codon:yes stop_codon:yes gene_type:complete